MSQRFWNKEGFPTELCWQYTWKKFNGENWYQPLRHEIFWKPNFSVIPKCSTTKFIGTLSQKIFDGKSWYSVLIKNFLRYLTFEIFETLDGSSRSFSVLWDKKNRRKTVIRKKVPEIPSFLKLRSGSQDFFANCETKFFDWRTWFSVLRHGKFRYLKISGRLKSLPTKFFNTVRPKKSKENRDAPLLSIKVFDVPKILKQRGIPYRALLAVYVKKIQRRKVISPS